MMKQQQLKNLQKKRQKLKKKINYLKKEKPTSKKVCKYLLAFAVMASWRCCRLSSLWSSLEYINTFQISGLHEWDDMSPEEFAKEKFGLEVPEKRSFGMYE